jgi:hypothetical protein
MAEQAQATALTPEQEEAQLLQMAAEFDRTGEAPAPTDENQDGDENKGAEDGEADLSAEKTNDDPDGDSGKPATEPDGENQKASKAAKEGERREKSWQKLNEEKAALKAEREALEQQKRELEQQRQQREQAQADTPKPNAEADEWDRVAKQLEEEGNAELAGRAKAKAKAARDAVAAETQKQSQAKFVNEWNSHLEKLTSENPDLQNPETALYKTVAELIKSKPVLSQYAAGISDAVAYAKTKLAADSVAGLQATIAEQKKQIDELNKKLSPSGSFPTPPPAGQKSFEQLSEKEQEAELRRMAERVDSER